MPVLKQNTSRSAMKDAIVLDLGDIGQQAARIRMQAEARAGEIVTAAQQKAKQLVEQASGEGFSQGHAEGLARGLEEGREQGRQEALQKHDEQLQQVTAAWSDVIAQWEAHRQQMDQEAREAVLEFALKMAERLVHRVIEVDRSVVVDQLANALQHVLRPLDVTVKINPADKPVLEAALPQLLAEFPRLTHIKLVEDADVTSGGCSVGYGQGEIDARIETQMERVIDLMLPVEEETP